MRRVRAKFKYKTGEFLPQAKEQAGVIFVEVVGWYDKDFIMALKRSIQHSITELYGNPVNVSEVTIWKPEL